MSLISIQESTLKFSGPLIFDQLNLQLEPRERVALLGRNGAGKTTLMKVMAGQLELDEEKITFQKGIQVTHLPQEVPVDMEELQKAYERWDYLAELQNDEKSV